jgi:hypothetical protein
MSLDDETPTQYFGPDAQVWKSPDGRVLQLSPAGAEHHAEQLAKHGWIHSGQEPLVFGPDAPDTGHRPGCAFGRTPRCTCTYLAQWDTTPAPAAATFTRSPELQELHDNRLAGKGTLQIPAADGSFIEFDLNASHPPMMCVGHDRVGWHYTEAISCEEWEKELDRVGAEKKPAPVADTAGYMSREDAESLFNVPGTLTPRETKMQLPVVIATAGDPAELAEKIIRQNPEYFGHLDPEGIYRPAEPSDIAKQLSDEKLRTEYQKGRAKMWEKNAMIASIMGTAGWAFAVARGVWGF